MMNTQDHKSLNRIYKQLEVALEKIKELEKENAEWIELLGRLKDFKEWKRWKIGEL